MLKRMVLGEIYSKYRNVFLLILPALYLLVSSVFNREFGNFYQFSVDPEYSIIYNAILIASGNLAINFIAHPATPLIYLSAISSRIVHFFTAETSLKEDFLNHPEKYIHAANTFVNLIIAISLFLCAIYIARLTKSFFIPLILQLSIFANQHTLGLSARLIPELSMLIPIILLTTLTIEYILSDKKKTNKYLWQFPILIAFGIACKLIFAPLIILPLVLIKANWKYRLKLIRNILILTALFAYPLITNINESSKWIKSIFTHSGIHGGGDDNIINWSLIPEHFISLYKLDPTLFIVIILSFIFYILQLFIKNKSRQLNTILAAILGISLSLFLVILLISKHFSLHYIMPFLAFKSILILLLAWGVYKTIKTNFIKLPLKVYKLIVATIIVIICGIEFKKTNDYQISNQGLKSNRLSDYKIVESLIDDNEAALINIPAYWGSPFIAQAHCYSFMHSYRRKTFYKTELKEKFPNFYSFIGWSDKFNHWDNFVELQYIIKHYDKVFLYSENQDDFKKVSKLLKKLEDITPLKKNELFSKGSIKLIQITSL